MNFISKQLVSLLFAIAILSISTTATRTVGQFKPSLESLESRLEGVSGWADCWTAMTELKSCTSEIVLFFMNGESYLTMECCHAIRMITHQCWPSMLSVVGFTVEEADILRGYCDADLAPPAPVTGILPLPNPAPAPGSAA